jgi:ribosomal protein L28
MSVNNVSRQKKTTKSVWKQNYATPFRFQWFSI